MLDRNRFRTAALSLALLASALQVGCSSDDSGAAPALEPFDSGQPSVPDASPGPSADPITVKAEGQGTVYSDGATVVDGGMVGTVACGSGSPAAQCTAPQRTTLYAVPATSWVFSGWTTTGLTPGQVLGEAAYNSFTVTTATPNPLIAVFVPQGGSGDSDAGVTAPVADAGHD